MKVTMMLMANDFSQEDLRSLIQAIREWGTAMPELATRPSLLLHTDPPLSHEEAEALLQEIGLPIHATLEVHGALPKELRLGPRGIMVGGKLVGTCDGMSITVAEAGEEEIQALEGAPVIGLVRMARG
ncbi:hypothetical protein LCGC14_1625280 [marine sediment metagenome]|uniref:Uncharacterized protein n=1 Tax=marine sediment metagenome TaxID=412755 RepID=A0A0F9L3X9_9ZZZZ